MGNRERKPLKRLVLTENGVGILTIPLHFEEYFMMYVEGELDVDPESFETKDFNFVMNRAMNEIEYIDADQYSIDVNKMKIGNFYNVPNKLL